MTDEVFDPKSLNIKAFLGNTDSLYQIPNYQRPYSWVDEEVEKLWEDVYGAFSNNQECPDEDKNYFLGSIIIIKPESGMYYDVVDGQQRLTTLMILLCVLRKLYPKINTDQEKNQERIVIKNIERSIFNEDDDSRLTFRTHSHNQNDFNNIIIDNLDIVTLKKPSKVKINQNVSDRFSNTAYIFLTKFKELGEKKTGEFINYLFNRVKIIKITCTEQHFAIKLFQVLNDRGMPLSSSDLIKSFLMSNLDNQDMNPFIADWEKLEKLVGDVDITMDQMWTLYLYYKKGGNPKLSLHDEMKEVFKNMDSNKAIYDVCRFAKVYRDEIYNAKDVTIYSLGDLHWEMYWRMIAITVFKESYEESSKILKLVHRYYYLNWIAGKTLTTIKQTSFNLIGWIKEKQTVDFISDKLETKILEDKVYGLVKQNLNGDVYFERWLKPLLVMIEYAMTDDSKNNYIEIDKHLHSEHILPQEFSRNSKWSHIDLENGVSVLNTFGNLTLLSGKKNIEASNYSFDEKLKVYSGAGRDGSKKTGKTSFEITKKIVESNISSWDLKEIEKRKLWYFEKIEELLLINVK